MPMFTTNYLLAIGCLLKSHQIRKQNVTIFCYKDRLPSINIKISLDKSVMMDVCLPNINDDTVDTMPTVTGWEVNGRGKMGPRMIDLSAHMDPIKLAAASSLLNLNLMRWRQLPALDIEKIGRTKVLLLGAGTLGCNVARTLLGWGVLNFTFLDNSRVSYSNPVRQSLFDFEDAKNGGKEKALAAAEALIRIAPMVKATGITLSIPMPGHPIGTSVEAIQEAEATYTQLYDLIDSHDVIFLGTDSRESRWLPTVLGTLLDKLVLNTALGFDTYVVMRHGRSCDVPTKLGCYFCNDVVAPENSLRDRTLDQMCTVTRPGLAPIAAAIAVELFVNLLHATSEEPSTVGEIPHQIRGFLSQFSSISPTGLAFDQCTACSDIIVNYMKTNGSTGLINICNDRELLEKLTGLADLRAAADHIDFDLDEDEDEALC